MVGAAIVALGLQQDPAATLERLATSIAGTPPSATAIALLTVLSYGLASFAIPRVALGSDGWIRHLPVSTMHRRIALAIAVACAEAPVVVAAIGCAALLSLRTGRPAWAGFVTPPFIALATSSLALGLRPRRRVRVRRSWMPPAVPFEMRVALRALGARLLASWLTGAIPLAAAFLFVRNNTVEQDLVRLAITFGGALAMTLTLAQLADSLAIRRPAWPWARSLPTSAARRVTGDIAFLSVACLPIAAVVVSLDPRAALAVCSLIPFLSARAAAAMRRDGNARSAASGPVLVEGAFAAALVALAPWLGTAALVAIPLAFRHAVRRERALKVTRWSALHHVAAGDTLSWTA